MQTLAIGLLVAATAWSQTPAAPPPKLQVLIITGQNGASHDWRATTPVLRKILEETGRFEVRVTEEFRGGGPETLAPYDVVLLHYYEKKDAAFRWGERADTALLNYVRSGKGWWCTTTRRQRLTVGRNTRSYAEGTGVPPTAAIRLRIPSR